MKPQKSPEKECSPKKFMDCMFKQRDLDCNNPNCMLSKNKTRDVHKQIEKIIEFTKQEGIKQGKAQQKEEDKIIIDRLDKTLKECIIEAEKKGKAQEQELNIQICQREINGFLEGKVDSYDRLVIDVLKRVISKIKQ